MTGWVWDSGSNSNIKKSPLHWQNFLWNLCAICTQSCGKQESSDIFFKLDFFFVSLFLYWFAGARHDRAASSIHYFSFCCFFVEFPRELGNLISHTNTISLPQFGSLTPASSASFCGDAAPRKRICINSTNSSPRGEWTWQESKWIYGAYLDEFWQQICCQHLFDTCNGNIWCVPPSARGSVWTTACSVAERIEKHLRDGSVPNFVDDILWSVILDCGKL